MKLLPDSPRWLRPVFRATWIASAAALVTTFFPIWCVSPTSGWCGTPRDGIFWEEVHQCLFEDEVRGCGQMGYNLEILALKGALVFLFSLGLLVYSNWLIPPERKRGPWKHAWEYRADDRAAATPGRT